MTAPADAVIEQLRSLDALLAEVLTPALSGDEARSMTDAVFLDFAALTESLGRRVDAARLIVASEIDDRSRVERGDARLSARMGCANAAELLSRVTRTASTTARARLRAARPIASSTSLTGERLPPTFATLRSVMDAGLVGLDTIAAITTTLGPIADRCHPADLVAAEAGLVGDAVGSGEMRGLGPDETLVQARVWALALDPDGLLPEDERAQRRRTLRLGRVRDGLVPLSALLLPDVAAQLQRLFDAHLSPRVGDRTGPRFTMDTDDSTASGATDPRSRPQKLHDVLASVLSLAARSSESPTIGGVSPALLVTISARDLDDERGVAFVDGTDITLPPYVARHIACSAGIQRLVFGDTGRVIELGSPQRVFTAHQRRAINARDGGCVIPGCRVPAVWCEVHHAREWADGGATHTDNGVLLCWHHHRTLDTGGWAVRLTDGVPETRAPAYIDPQKRWRPSGGSAHRQHHRVRERIRAG